MTLQDAVREARPRGEGAAVPTGEPPASQVTVPVSVVVMTYNEEVNLARCLDSVRAQAGEILVVDSFSTDGTVALARRYTDRIYQHRYESHPQQWRWALATLPFAHEWVLAVDADFAVTPELWQAIDRAVRRGDPGLDGYFVRHRQVFLGRVLRHGTMYPRYWLRLFRHRRTRVDPEDLVDVHFLVAGRTGRLEGDVVEDNVKDRDLGAWVQKQLRFAERQAVQEALRLPGDGPGEARLLGDPDQRTRWLKRWWGRLPLYVRPWLLFGYRYVLRLGFLDGRAGFLYHFTQALLYRVLVDARLDELRAEARSDAPHAVSEAARPRGGGP
jgi:glycosyltransferase involved in cell wall biosynthesis